MKPTINLLRGNMPKEITVGKKGVRCWRCDKKVPTNDTIYQIAGPIHHNNGRHYNSPNRKYCRSCMEAHIERAEKTLNELKTQISS